MAGCAGARAREFWTTSAGFGITRPTTTTAYLIDSVMRALTIGTIDITWRPRPRGRCLAESSTCAQLSPTLRERGGTTTMEVPRSAGAGTILG
jgi:hypothetical protein